VCTCLNCISNLECESDFNNYSFSNNEDFCTWLFSDTNHNFIAIAHNMKSYDGYFIMNYILSNIKPNERLPEIVLNGSKILVINFSKVTIKDSLNLIPMALSKFPKTFGFKELKKGFFPHFFNIPENQSYIGVYPPPSSYGCDFMSVTDNKNFFLWYNDQREKTFDFKKELLEYCQSDVDILAQSCLSFRKLFIEITKTTPEDTGVDPFTQCLTMPAACHYVFRRNFMRQGKLDMLTLQVYIHIFRNMAYFQ
jgi:hypothetical protein